MRFIFVLTFCVSLISSGEASAKLRFGSYNIRNFDYDQRSHVPTNKEKLFQTIQEMNADFIAVQEINQTEVFKDYIQVKFEGKYQVALTKCGGAHDQRLGFVYDKSLFQLVSFKEDLRVSNPFSPKNGLCYEGSRPLAVGVFKMKENGKLFVAISVHLKAGGQDRSIRKRFKQLELISEVIREHKAKGFKDFVVMGDFNSTEYIYRGRIQADFVRATKEMNLKDVSSNLSCTSYWWGGRRDGKQYPSQLDHILISESFGKSQRISDNKTLAANAQAYGHCAKLACGITRDERMGPSYDEVSDHCPIVSTVE